MKTEVKYDPDGGPFINIDEVLLADGMSFEDGVLHAAKCYIKAGIPVLPLEPNSKKLPSGGGINYLSATIKETTVIKWFGEEGKYRGFNIGIGCGIDGGVMALDVDAKPVSGTTGLKQLAKIIEKEGQLPEGPRQITPSGGNHYLYKWQSNAVSSSSKVAPGLDTRGGTREKCTGHIVAYPSVFMNNQYRWEEGGPVPAMPEWLSVSLGQAWQDKPKDQAPKKEVPVGQINRMLTIIDPDSLSYEDWVKVGMALKSVCGEDGLEIWDEWSSGGARRKEGECKARWKSFKEDGPVGLGTLLFMAKEAGWRPLTGDVSNSDADAEIEERVLEMNKKYALVRVNKNMIIATFDNNSNGERVGFLSMQSFFTMAATEKMQMATARGFSEKPMADFWLASENRRQYWDIGIYPNDDQPSGTLNMWNGWSCVPNPKAKCNLYLNHMRDVVCDRHESVFEWLLDWMADCVQDARNIKGTCVVLRGVEGCGKGAWADQFGQLFGKHYTHLIDAERLTTKFNSLMSDSVVVFADEVLWPGDRKAANILKGMVTERRVTRESKGVDSIEVDNLGHIIIASNEDWIVPAGPQSRRWLVLNVSGDVAQNKEYFDRLFKEMENGGREALLHLLMKRKITNNLRLAPHTVGLTEQRRMSHRHDSLLHFITESVIRGSFNTIDYEADMSSETRWPRKVVLYELFDEYRVWCRDNRISSYDTQSIMLFSENMPKYGFSVNGKILAIPPLEEVSKAIDTKQGTHLNEV